MLEDLFEVFKMTVGALIVGFIIFILFAIPGVFTVNWFEKNACAKYELITGKPTAYTFFGGCYVQSGSGDMVHLDQYTSMLIAKEGLLRGE